MISSLIALALLAPIQSPTYVKGPLVLGGLNSDPSSPANGWMYFNSTSKKFRCWVDTGWRDCSAISGSQSQTVADEGTTAAASFNIDITESVVTVTCQDLNLVDADPTFGGTVDAVWRLDQDSRIGYPSSDEDGYYYYLSGGADTKVHWLTAAHSIAASALIDVLKTDFPVFATFKPQYSPMPAALYSAATTGTPRNSGGSAATDGQGVSTWLIDGSTESGTFTCGAGPVYETNGFGGQPSIIMTSSSYCTAAGSITWGRGTLAITYRASAAGFGVWGDGSGGLERIYLHPNNAFTALHSDASSAYNGINVTPDLLGNIPHVLVFTFTGNSSGVHVYLDGTELAGTPTNSGNPGFDLQTGIIKLGHPSSGFTGEIGEIYFSPIPLSTAERKMLENYWGSLRGITIAP